MEPARSRAKLTYADFEQLPDDLLRHEIIDGEHCVTPAPSTRHQRVTRRLLMALGTFLEHHPLGEVFCAPFDVLLSHHDVVEPDLIYVSNERLPLLTAKNLQGPPDLVVEILSPGTKRRDLTLKRDLYRRVGVREYWLVDPDANGVTAHRWLAEDEARVTVYSEGDVLETRLLPGLQLEVTALLA